MPPAGSSGSSRKPRKASSKRLRNVKATFAKRWLHSKEVEGAVILSGTVTLRETTTISSTDTGTISGAISDDAGEFGMTTTSTFAGPVILSGANTDTGATAISKGILVTNGTQTAATTAVSVPFTLNQFRPNGRFRSPPKEANSAQFNSIQGTRLGGLS